MSRNRTDEAHIVINGKELTNVEAMTIRVALEGFAHEMENPDALGTDPTGRAITAGYQAAIVTIREKIYA